MISSSEVAFFSLTHNDFLRLREEDSAPARRILKLKEKPRTLLATILISNNFIKISIVLIANYLLTRLLPDTTFWGMATTIRSWFPAIAISEEGLIQVIIFLVAVLGVSFYWSFSARWRQRSTRRSTTFASPNSCRPLWWA
ncbi:MAG: DUF21 domain-containing protein [Saprospirales bacterium]|nr:DUF21 domain-containing protein [Saprospirales bacterium]